MEYRVLGPLEVVRDGEEVALAGGRPRALLAILLLHRNEVVATDRLVDALWDGAPPATATKILQLYVSQLRKALPEAGLRTRAPGYVLELDEDELDAARFERLVADARLASPVSAAKQLRDALALWRGAPLADFAYESFAQTEIARLAELRLAALEDRIEADLELGRQAELIPELEVLVAEYPLRERLRGLLIRGLYASGRQAEALQAYAEARQTLDRELGIEPSRALQDLQRRVLAQDPTLEPPPTARATGGRLGVLVPGPLRRRSAALLVAGGVLLGAGLTAAALELRHDSAPHLLVPNRLVGIDTATGQIRSDIQVGATPTNVAANREGVWVVNGDDQTISLADPSTGRIETTFGVGRTPTAVAVGDGAVWVGDGAPTPAGVIGAVDTVAVSRVDPSTRVVTRTVRLPSSHDPGAAAEAEAQAAVQPSGVSRLAVGARGVWAIDPDLTVARLDPATGKIAAVVPTVATNAIAAGAEGVWAVGNGPVLTRIDPHTNRPAQTIRLPASGLAGVAVGAGSVWATDPADGLVWRVEPGAQPVSRSIDADAGVTGIAFADGALWATNFADGTVLRIDPETSTVSARIHLTGTPEGVGVAAGTAWVTVAGDSPRGSLPAPACGPVESGGVADPDVLIASGLPLQGPQAAVTNAMAAAVRSVLRRHGFKAGRFTVGYESCDNSTAQSGGDDFLKCASNAKAFADTIRLVGVIGPYTSGCAQVAVPLTARVTQPLAIISPANTLAGLTHRVADSAYGEPGRYYPTGVRNYFRVVASDDFEGEGQAVLAGELGLRRVYLLSTGRTSYGTTLTDAFRRAAARVGVTVVGSSTWDPASADYDPLARTVARARPDGVVLADYDLHGGAVIRALRLRLGPGVKLIAGDGFLPVPAVVKEAGAAATGMYVSFPGLANAGGTYIPEAAAAAQVLLAAIARSDGTRASVLEALRGVRVNTVLGPVRFDRNGDMAPPLVGVVRIDPAARPGLAGELRESVPVRTVSVPTAPGG